MLRQACSITSFTMLFSAMCQAEEPPICTDRPTKSNAVCTVPAGRWQLETDLFNYTHNRDGGTTTNTWVAPNPTIKYGLNDRSDIEFNWVPWTQVKVSHEHRQNSVGDLYIRYKQQLTEPTANFRVGIIPYIKVPTARNGVGNARFEGGMIVPINVALPHDLTLTLGPQLDVLLDEDRNGHHLNMVNLINLSKPLTSRLTVYGELWMDNNFEPNGSFTQTSADFAAAFFITPTIQLDFGTNIGLNDHTPDYQVYTGFSARF